MNNMSTKYEFGKRTYDSLKELCDSKSLVSYNTVRQRLHRGWNIVEAISTPSSGVNLSKHFQAIFLKSTNKYTVNEISKITKLSKKQIEGIL